MRSKSIYFFLILVYFTSFVVFGTEGGTVQITYTIWAGDDISEIHQLPLTAPTDSTFYEVMGLASGINSNYEFEASLHPTYGHYVYRLAHRTEKPDDKVYWMLYVLNDAPDPNNPPPTTSLSDYGVDTLKVQDGKHYLFWYKTFVYQGNK